MEVFKIRFYRRKRMHFEIQFRASLYPFLCKEVPQNIVGPKLAWRIENFRRVENKEERLANTNQIPRKL